MAHAVAHVPQHMLSPAGLAIVASGGQWRLPAPPPGCDRSHLDVLDEILQDLAAGRTRRAVIQAPPRHGKSLLCSVWTPAWYLGRWPERRIILASYDSGLASNFGRQARDILDEHGQALFGVRLRDDVAAAGRWDIEVRRQGRWKRAGGGMIAVGAGAGGITGFGANLIIIDDPVKNRDDAMSKLRRERVWDWYTSTARTRLEPGGSMMVIMTRWHNADLAGRLLKDSGEEWMDVRMPALAEPDDMLGRVEGEPLWPGRFDAASLEAMNREDPFWFSALYQQRPRPPSGSYFRDDMFRYYRTETVGDMTVYDLDGQRFAHDEGVVFTTVDLAASKSDQADYTVAMTFWLHRATSMLLVLDVTRRRMEGPDHIRLVKQVFEKWRPSLIGIESVAYQMSLVQMAKREGLPVKALQADRDKVARALPAATRMEGGNVWLPGQARWLRDFEAELLEFPAGDHDDQVDCLGYGVLEAIQLTGRRKVKVY